MAASPPKAPGPNRRFVIDAKGLPDLPGVMLATIEALKAIGGSASIDALDEKAIEIEGVTAKDIQTPI